MRNTFALSMLAAGVFACAEERPSIIWEGRHLRVGTSEDAGQVCRGTFDWADDYVGNLKARFGSAEDLVVSHYWVSDATERESFCESTADCARGPETFSKYVINEHEFVHATRFHHDHASMVFEEGIAEVFGFDADVFGPVEGDISHTLVNYDGESGLPRSKYPLAGHFVSYLLDEYGPRAFDEFSNESTYNDDLLETLEGFESSFGTHLDEVVEDYEQTYPVCDRSAYQNNEFECSRGEPLHVPDGGRLDLSANLDCHSSDVLGPRNGERWTTRTVAIPARGSYEISSSKSAGEFNGSVRFSMCGGTCKDIGEVTVSAHIDAPVGPERRTALCLEEAVYVLRMAAAEGDVGDVHVGIRSSDPQPGCGD